MYVLNNHACKDTRLILDMFRYMNTDYRRYPCLCIAWAGQVYKDMAISIDIVPVYPTRQSTGSVSHFEKHVNLPHSTEQQQDVSSEYQHMVGSDSMKKQDLAMTKQTPNVYKHLYKSNPLVVSELENHIILSVPEYIRQGYRLAKAIRIARLLQPLFSQLIFLGVTGDIHNTVRSYMIKTCILYLTHRYRHTDGDTNSRFCWAIKTYSLLRKCVISGTMYEYFDSEKELFKCKHALSNEELPRFRCCRERKARLLIVDLLLDVLKHNTKHKRCFIQEDTSHSRLSSTSRKGKQVRTRRATSRVSIHSCGTDFDQLRPAPFYENGYPPEELR